MGSSRVKTKVKLIQDILATQHQAWEAQLKRFIPDDPQATPTEKQKEFFSDSSYYKLLKAGNRTGKTFSTTRELAWKLCRTHPYRDTWNAVSITRKKGLKPLDIFDAYMNTDSKVFWVLGPDYNFLDATLWEMYLQRMIPSWFYTDDDGNETIKYTQQGNISEVRFRNGDVLQFKSYAQRSLSLMGRKIDEILVDEMPPHLTTITELMMRLQDTGGSMTMGFTPLVTCEEVKDLMESHEKVKIFKWMIHDNPLYRDNPEKLARFIEDMGAMPKNQIDARLNGEWYYELTGGFVFEGLTPQSVEPFEIPVSWRRVRVADPATHTTGYTEYAEDPLTGTWYCTRSEEFHWDIAVSPALLVKTIESLKPHPDYRYFLSLYDNAESWFGATAPGWCGCLHKNRAQAIMSTRTAVSSGRVKFFKGTTELVLGQMQAYRKREDGSIVKRNDHALDTLMYFSRQIPEHMPELAEEKPTLMREIVDHALRRTVKPSTIPYERGMRMARRSHKRNVR